MSTFVMIHGAWFGAWANAKVIPFLQRAGHRVIAPDLPGHGADTTPLAQLSLNVFVDRVVDTLDVQREPVILVGHSAGGAVISQAAEYRPDKVKTLVYLTAFLLRNGENINSYAMQDKESLIPQSIEFAADQSWAKPKDVAFKDLFMADACDQDAEWAMALSRPESGRFFVDPVQLTDKYERLPRVYIRCTNDRTISPAIQKLMYTNTACDRVYSMDTSHAPFLAKPMELASHLLDIERQKFHEQASVMTGVR